MNYFFVFFLFSFQALAVTLGEWQNFSREQKINYFSENISDVEFSLDDNRVKSSNLSSPRLEIIKLLLEDILIKLSSYKSELYTEVEDDMYALIGPLQRSADLYFSQDNHFIGAQIIYFQPGCSHLDDNGEWIEGGGQYINSNEAESNNCFDNDVSWTGYSIIDQNYQELENSEIMYWSGH